MTGVYLFWAWVVVSSLAVLFAAHSRPGRWACRLYRPLLLVAFSLVTLAAVGRYLVHASWGKLDSAIGLWYLQALINPAVRMIVESEPLASLLYEPLAELRMGGGNRLGAGVALVLWEVMVEDLFLGNLFWLGVGTLWLWFVRRRTEASEEPRGTWRDERGATSASEGRDPRAGARRGRRVLRRRPPAGPAGR